MDKVDILAKKIWDYMHMNHEIQKSDCILVFGSKDLMPAHRACDLFFKGYAPLIIFSGNHGAKKVSDKTEAEIYADIAYERGVPKESVFIENKSTNTGENTIFSKELIKKKNIPHKKIILVQKPYMERRTHATFKKNWPEPEIFVTSPQVNYEEYMTDRIINKMVGALIRIHEYPKLDFQIEQDIPEDVWEAGQELVGLGYNKNVL